MQDERLRSGSSNSTPYGGACFAALADPAERRNPSSGVSVTVTPRSCPCSIWPPSAAPVVATDADNVPIELGVKFFADTNGSIAISGIRFFKSTTNTGTHVASLWTANGALLAQATFTSESSSGWQQVNFAAPVVITAGTHYVASYHTNIGHYAGDNNYFLNSSFDNPPLHALKTGTDGGNGVYLYSANQMREMKQAVTVVALVFGLHADSHAAEQSPDVIYQGGTVVTVNELQPAAEAVAVRGGCIVAVGYRDELMKLKGPKTKVVDLAGKTMIPGLIDAHGHVFMTGIQALSANMLRRRMARGPMSHPCNACSRSGPRRTRRPLTRSAGSSASATTTRS